MEQLNIMHPQKSQEDNNQDNIQPKDQENTQDTIQDTTQYTAQDTKQNTTQSAIEDKGPSEEYEIVEIEIFPEKIVCPDCGGITLEGLDFCDKCGGELHQQ